MCYLAVFFVVLYLFRKHGTQLCYETLQIYTNYQRPLHSGISRLSNVPSVQSLKKCYLGIHTSVFLYVPIVMTVQRLYEDFLKIFLDFAHMQKAMLSFGLISSILQFLHAKFNIPTIAIGFKVGNQHRQNPVSSNRYFGVLLNGWNRRNLRNTV